jgi:hypothetical protein
LKATRHLHCFWGFDLFMQSAAGGRQPPLCLTYLNAKMVFDLCGPP